MRASLAAVATVATLGACGRSTATSTGVAPLVSPAGSSAAIVAPAPPIDAPAPSQEEQLAAIQKAMNELSPASQQCWAAAAVERFDIEGDLAAQIDIGPPVKATIVRDTTRNTKLAACLADLLEHYPWAPPLRGQTIQLPFEFKAPAGQSVIDRRLVPFAGQGKLSVAVLLDENNTGNEHASMLELAIGQGGTTGLRWADRAELWFFLGDAEVSSVALGKTAVHAGDMMYAPAGSAREVAAPRGDAHAMIVIAPGGREGSARAGALPNREVTGWRSAPMKPYVVPAASAKTFGPATIFVEPQTVPNTALAASVLALGADAKVPEHVHASETELLYVLDGAGTITIAGTEIAVGPTSVLQIPPNTKHAFAAAKPFRAVQIYTPAGPEQRSKREPVRRSVGAPAASRAPDAAEDRRTEKKKP